MNKNFGKESKMKKAIEWVLILAAFFGAKHAVTTYFNSKSNSNYDVSQKKIQEAVNLQNQTLPIMVDKETEFFNMAAVEGGILYNYRFVNYTLTEENSPKLKNAITQNLFETTRNGVCTTPELRRLLNAKLILIYSYYDKQKSFIAKNSYSISNCEK